MTQTSPKPADQTSTNGHDPKSPARGYVGGHTTPSPKPQLKPRSVPAWRKILQGWGNLSLRYKLALLLMSGAAVPVIAVTQSLVLFSQHNAQATLEETLRSNASGFVADYILWAKQESEWQANTIAKTVEAAKINLQNPKLVEPYRPLLQTLVSEASQNTARPESSKNFRIITNAQGKTVAQYIQIIKDYPLGSDPYKQENLQQVSLPTGINLGDVPIIKDALSTGRTLSGVELLSGKAMQRIGLGKQAIVPLKTESTQGLSKSEQPFPEGTYPNIAQGRTSLVAVAVQPIKVQGKVVGVAVVGALLNKNHTTVDAFGEIYNSATSVFAQDLKVSTNVAAPDSKTRSIGTRVAREVAEVVLNQGKEFFGYSNIVGRKYLTAYSPLYDHQKELNPTVAKPVGMAFVGITPETVESAVGRLQLIGYSIGGSMLLLAGLLAVPIASSFARPLRRLAGFAQQVGAGEQGVRLEATERQDEIGVLSQELNQMAADIEVSLKAQRQEAERAKILKDITVLLGQYPQNESILDTAMQEIRLALKTDRVVIYRFNEDWQGTIVVESVAEGWPRALGAQIDDPCFREQYVEKYRQGHVGATANIYEAANTECHIKQLEVFAVKANLVAPILRDSRRQLIGLLIAHQCSAPRAWQQGEIELFVQLTNQIGFALDRANLLEQQSTAKEQLQKRALELLMQVDPVSRGDLTIRASVTEDEIGTIADSYNATISSLRKIVTQVQAAARVVTATTTSSEASASELSKEALRQAQEITVALDRIQEMSNSIRAVATSAEQAEAAVKQATQTVEAGDAAMNRTVEGILAIRETVAQTSKKVKRLGESSQKISKVVNLIGTFADQTNLLALNASIEAANAGEQGRGFAVVAERVRALARQSALATAEIESLVKDIQTETNEVVAAMEAGTEQVVSGTKLVDETRLSLNQITATSTQISALVEAISEAASAQSQASESVTQTISDVAMSAHQTSTEAMQVSASFKELLAVAQELQGSAAQFKVS